MNEYIKPVEAFKKLEAAKLLKQNVYIYGATGYGKTELIKQYFKKDKYIYIFHADKTAVTCPLSPMNADEPLQS